MDFERFFRETLMKHAPDSSNSVTAPVIGIDECANQPAVWAVIKRALHENLANRAVELWAQRRQKSDDSFVLLTGRPIRGALPPGEEFGLPVKGYSYPDEQVASLLVAQFLASDRVILVTANKKFDVHGIRLLLLNEIRPALESHHCGRFGLLVLMKKGKTSWQSYTENLYFRLRSSNFQEGFEYTEV